MIRVEIEHVHLVADVVLDPRRLNSKLVDVQAGIIDQLILTQNLAEAVMHKGACAFYLHASLPAEWIANLDGIRMVKKIIYVQSAYVDEAYVADHFIDYGELS